MHSELDLPYTPKRSTIAAIMTAFAVGASFLGYMALTEAWTPASSGMLRIASAAAALAFLMCVVLGSILLRSKNWRLRVDANGVSIDTLVGRRSVTWSDLQDVRMIGEGSTRGVAVTGTRSSLAINAMMMADPSQLERVFLALQQRMQPGGPATQSLGNEF